MTFLLQFLATSMITAGHTSARRAAHDPTDVPPRRISVRVYGDATSDASDASDADAFASALWDTKRILDEAGVDLDVQSCQHWQSGDEHDPCARPPRPDEYSIRTYRSSEFSPRTGTHRLAYTLMDFSSGRGSLVTIDLTAIEWLAGTSGSDATLLLGRTVAHELGHLLLRSPEHAKSGLMRAVWSNKELQRNRVKDWSFAFRQVAEIRAQRTPNVKHDGNPVALVGDSTR
jgi:hypothetical protein